METTNQNLLKQIKDQDQLINHLQQQYEFLNIQLQEEKDKNLQSQKTQNTILDEMNESKNGFFNQNKNIKQIYQNEISNLSFQNNEKNKQINQLQKENQRLVNLIETNQTSYEKYEKQNKSYKAQIFKLQDSNFQLENDKTQFQYQLELNYQNQQTQKQIEDNFLNQFADSYNNQIKELQNKIEKQNHDQMQLIKIYENKLNFNQKDFNDELLQMKNRIMYLETIERLHSRCPNVSEKRKKELQNLVNDIGIKQDHAVQYLYNKANQTQKENSIIHCNNQSNLNDTIIGDLKINIKNLKLRIDKRTNSKSKFNIDHSEFEKKIISKEDFIDAKLQNISELVNRSRINEKKSKLEKNALDKSQLSTDKSEYKFSNPFNLQLSKQSSKNQFQKSKDSQCKSYLNI